MKYHLSVIGIFKNESWIMQEWIEHYLAEGVEHFYLIDNGSSDNINRVLDTYLKEGLVDVIHDDRPHMQTEHYNNHFLNQVKTESEWVMVVDFDEFIYSRPPFSTISAYLRSLAQNIGQVHVPWKLFGSCGLIQQPSNCLDHLIRRTKYTGVKTNGMPDNEHMLTKTVIRTKYLTHLGIHCSDVTSCEITSDGKPISGQKCYQAISEDILRKSSLHCNHYPLQSFEWFRQVKMNRGSASHVRNDNVRTTDYYNSFDGHSGQVQDTELSEKRGKFKAYYGVGQTYRDVTRYVLKSFKTQEGLTVPSHVVFNHVFGDPVVDQEKYFVVRQGYQLSVYPEANRPTLCFTLK